MLQKLLFSLLFISSSLIVAESIDCSSTNFCLISIAKSGTHLIDKCLSKLTNKERVYISQLSDLEVLNQRDNIFIGTHFFHREVLKQVLFSIKPKKTLINIRDPRAVIVSAAFFYEDFIYLDPTSPHYWSRLYKFNSLPIEERVKVYLRKALAGEHIPIFIYDIKNVAATIRALDQKNQEYALIRFENLVGERGGGTQADQLEAIQKISSFLELPSMDQDQIIKIRSELFGDSFTFRKGNVKGWEKYFDNEAKKMCKQLIGKEIIELGYEKDSNW
ncbi:MAG: hypothetical protein S4CHLAM7_07110 [Chlamydiae bacterium]|nr:hypothetical protein [Chlamydiota bacterium]